MEKTSNDSLRKISRCMRRPSSSQRCPPLESLKYLLRRAVQDKKMSMTHLDATLAYFYAEASRDISVKLPSEDQHGGDEEKCGKLRKARYGTRDVAQNWQRKCSDTVRALGFRISRG